MSRRDPFDVVVVGAGVVGATAALAAVRDGLRVALVEAREPPAWREDVPDLRVYAFAPDASALLDDLGAWAPLRAARAQPYRRMRVWDAAGGGELVFDADALGRPELGHIVEHGLLVDRLRAACVRETGLQRLCPATVTAFESGDDSASIELDDGRRLHARLVVGADGAASPLRALAGIEADEHDYRQRAIVAYVGTERAHESTAWQRFLPGGPLAFLPCADGRSSIVWTLPEAEAARRLAVDDATFLRELTRAFDARLGEVVSVSARASFPLRRVLARRLASGRLALAGDVALRAMWRRAAERGHDPGAPHRLARWERTRRSEAAVAAHAFETIDRTFSSDALLPTLLRGPVLGLAGRLPPLTRLLWQRAAGL